MTREQIDDAFYSNQGKKGKHLYRVTLVQPHEKKNEHRDLTECSRVVKADNKQMAVAFAKNILKLEFGEQVSDFVLKEVFKLGSKKR